jgi:hypothetical protein
MGKQIAIAALFLASYGCGGNRYTVIGRTNDQGSPDWVKVVLAHDGQKIYANCNNLKAGAKGK